MQLERRGWAPKKWGRPARLATALAGMPKVVHGRPPPREGESCISHGHLCRMPTHSVSAVFYSCPLQRTKACESLEPQKPFWSPDCARSLVIRTRSLLRSIKGAKPASCTHSWIPDFRCPLSPRALTHASADSKPLACCHAESDI